MCSGGTSGSRPKSWKNQQKASVSIQFTRPGRRGWWNAGRAGRTGIRCQALCFPCPASIQVPPVKCWEHTFLQGRLQWWWLWSPVSRNIIYSTRADNPFYGDWVYLCVIQLNFKFINLTPVLPDIFAVCVFYVEVFSWRLTTCFSQNIEFSFRNL